ncbi:Helix-turn-helix domain protein [Rickettsiales bacterium Ac37b]|nr:Helix-turn-helix domain protein [Rickettsiales bacterium Ac37b]
MCMKATLQQNIKNRMGQKKLNIRDMERNAGVKRGSFYNIISGRSLNPTLDTLSNLADILDCSVSDLINETPRFNSHTVEKNKENLQTEQHLWNDQLFTNIVHKVLAYLKEKRLNPTFEQVLSFIKETYLFSLKENPNTNIPNERFIEWIIERGI